MGVIILLSIFIIAVVMTVKEIKEGMTAPEVAQTIKDNFDALNTEKETVVNVGKVKESVDNANKNTGVSNYPAFSATENVAVGVVRNYNGLLYRSIVAGANEWNEANWERVSLESLQNEKLTELASKTIEFVGYGPNGATAGVTEVGQYYYNTDRKYLVKKEGETKWVDITWRKDAIYIYKNEVYVWNGSELVKSTQNIELIIGEIDVDVNRLNTLSGKLNLVIGSIDVSNGKDSDSTTRLRNKGFLYAPFEVKMNDGYYIHYVYCFTQNGEYVDYRSSSASELYESDDKYIYKLTFRKHNNSDITANEIDDFIKSYEGGLSIVAKSNKEQADRLLNLEKIVSPLIIDQEKLFQYNTELTSVYVDGSGDLSDADGFSVRTYDVTNISKVKIEGTGAGISRRYAFYSSNEVTSTNCIIVGPAMDGTNFSSVIDVPQNATMMAVTYRTSWNQTIYKIESSSNATFLKKKELKILFFGNSFTLGSIGYAPFLLKEHFNEDIDITIGIAFISGGTLGPTWDGVENHYQKISDDSAYTYFKYANGNNAWVSKSANPSEMLNDEEWDIVSFQQGSNNAPNYDTYQPYLNDCIDLISQKVAKPVKVAWLIPHADVNVFGNQQEQNILDSANRVMDETIAQIVIPYGTAIANARTTTLKNLGDSGNLLYEGKHLQNGIPMLVANYCSMISILDLVGLHNKSIVGINSIEVNDAWVDEHNIPNASAVGNCVGVTSANCRIAAKCAIMAVKKPYTIMEV